MMKKLLSLMTVLFLLMPCLTGCADRGKELSGQEIYEKLSPSTVEIYAESDYVSSLGTGFYIDNSGTVVTNYHVISDCSSAYVTANDGGMYEVTSVVGYSEELDLAILSTSKVDSQAVITCTEVTTGEAVYVLGSSVGLTGTFSEGLVSTAERHINGATYIQISAPISPGNSGGPVVNSRGQVVGIACAGREDGQNLNFAIPISEVDKISKTDSVTMEEFFQETSEYAYIEGVFIPVGNVAIRHIAFGDQYSAKLELALWEQGEATEATMVEMMDESGMEQGGGQLYIIAPGDLTEPIDTWCFDPSRRPGDYAIIESEFGYSICYFSMLNGQ